VLQPGTNNMATQLRGSAQSLTNVIVAAYLQARAPLAKRRIRIRHGRVTPRSIYADPLPILQAQLPSGAEILAPRPVDLRTRADLPESERLVSREQLQHVRSAVLKLDVFDANGGMFADKWMLLNGVRIGRLPANPEPLSSWHVCRINLPREALEKLTLDNVFGLKDETGDAYKIRVRQLTVTLDDGRAVSTPEDASVFSSSMEWPLAEGERLHRDGRTVTVLSF
jgi:hypothetical protein